MSILDTSSITSTSTQSITTSITSSNSQDPMVDTNVTQPPLIDAGGGGGSKEIGSIVDVAV